MVTREPLGLNLSFRVTEVGAAYLILAPTYGAPQYVPESQLDSVLPWVERDKAARWIQPGAKFRICLSSGLVSSRTIDYIRDDTVHFTSGDPLLLSSVHHEGTWQPPEGRRVVVPGWGAGIVVRLAGGDPVEIVSIRGGPEDHLDFYALKVGARHKIDRDEVPAPHPKMAVGRTFWFKGEPFEVKDINTRNGTFSALGKVYGVCRLLDWSLSPDWTCPLTSKYEREMTL